MSDAAWDSSGAARQALITAVEELGASALSSPTRLENLLKDLLPDLPREASLMVAAAEVNMAGMLTDRVASGVDVGTAIRLGAATLSQGRPFDPSACRWVAREFALALGLNIGPEAENDWEDDPTPQLSGTPFFGPRPATPPPSAEPAAPAPTQLPAPPLSAPASPPPSPPVLPQWPSPLPEITPVLNPVAPPPGQPHPEPTAPLGYFGGRPPVTPPPGPPTPPPRRSRRALFIAAVVVVALIVVVGGGAAALELNKHSNSSATTTTSSSTTATTTASTAVRVRPKTSIARSVTTSSTSTSTTSTLGTPSVPPGLTDINGYLAQSARARTEVSQATEGVQNCNEDPASALTPIEAGLAIRQGIAGNLPSVDLSGVPGGRQLLSSLTAAIHESVAADQAFVAWVEDVQAANGQPSQGQAAACSQYQDDSHWQAANVDSTAATNAKMLFVSEWNPLASTYGLTQYAYDGF